MSGHRIFDISGERRVEALGNALDKTLEVVRQLARDYASYRRRARVLHCVIGILCLTLGFFIGYLLGSPHV
jgi:hypothetical protein